MTPRASERQCGANRPLNAGTNTTSPAVGHGTGERLDLGRVADDPQVVAQPLDERPGDRHGPLERVRGRRVRAAESRGDRRDEPVLRLDRRLARVHQHEAARAVRALDLARPRNRSGRTARPAGRRGCPAIGTPARSPVPVAVDLGRAADLGEHRARDPHLVEQLRVPLERREVHEHRARGIRDVGDVDATTAPRRSAARSATNRWSRTAARHVPRRLDGRPRRGSRRASGPTNRSRSAARSGLESGRRRRPPDPPPPARARPRPSGCPATRSPDGPAGPSCDPTRRSSRAGR